MPDHTWMKDVLVDIAMYAEKHAMWELYTQVALAIEAALPFASTADQPSADMNNVVVELAGRRPPLAMNVGDDWGCANRNN